MTRALLKEGVLVYVLLSLVISLWSEMLAESASPQGLSVWEWTEGKKYKEKARAKKKKKKARALGHWRASLFFSRRFLFVWSATAWTTALLPSVYVALLSKPSHTLMSNFPNIFFSEKNYLFIAGKMKVTFTLIQWFLVLSTNIHGTYTMKSLALEDSF